jgi:hypothetical protein
LKDRISALNSLSFHTGAIDVHCMVQIFAPSCIDSWPELDNHCAHEMKSRLISNQSFRFQIHRFENGASPVHSQTAESALYVELQVIENHDPNQLVFAGPKYPISGSLRRSD